MVFLNFILPLITGNSSKSLAGDYFFVKRV